MTKLINIKENVRIFYDKNLSWLHPLFKAVLSLLVLLVVQQMFGYNAAVNKPPILIAVSVIQAFLPLSFLFYSGSVLIMLNLWNVSLELLAFFFILFLICCLSFIRIDSKYIFILMLTPVLFFLKLEYLLPVVVGMTVGTAGLLPVVGGILVYFFSVYTRDASALIAASSGSETGIGIQRVVRLMLIDKKLLVILVAFCLVILVASALYRMFHENAWMFCVVISNVALALLLLSGRLIFELDYAIWRVFLEIILAIGLDTVVQFFKGIGDVSRIEKVSFEDEEYIYYVKAVPKMKVAQAERSVTALGFEEDNAGADEEVIEKPEESVESQDISAGKEELLPRGEKED